MDEHASMQAILHARTRLELARFHLFLGSVVGHCDITNARIQTADWWLGF